MQKKKLISKTLCGAEVAIHKNSRKEKPLQNKIKKEKDEDKTISVEGPIVAVQSLSRIQLCHPIDCSMLGFPVLHCLPQFVQTHVHWVGDAI